MGLCRFLNVLLGFSLLSAPEFDWRYFQFAGIVGLYIVGVTWFARTEAKTSGRVSLILASCVMMAAVVQAISLPISLESRDDLMFYPYLFALWTLIVALPIIEAIRTPEPKKVQAAVKRCIMGLIGLDALLAFAVVGWPGLWILVLLIPAVVLGRWVYST
jgi:4-hydroxybenzoate polyprenyltransferase